MRAMTAGESAAEQARRKREKAERLLRDAERWDRGADGERQVGAMLDQLPDQYVVFHDLQIPNSKANVDHLVLGPSGIWAIDTKNYQYPVTIGSGKGAGKLWSGRRPLADKMETTKWEADSVADLISYPVDAVMCIIAPSLPKPKFEFAGLTVCAPSHLRQVFADADGAVDVGAAELAVRYAFDASPAAKATPFVASPTPPPSRSPQPPKAASSAKRSRRTPRRAPSKSIRSATPSKRGVPKELIALGKLVALGVGAIVAISLLPSVSTWLGQRASESIMDDVMETADNPIERASATTAAATEPTLPVEPPEPVNYVVRCVPGGRWTVSWGWPGEPPAGVAGYGIRMQDVDGADLNVTFVVWDIAQNKPADIYVDADSADFDVVTQYRSSNGEVLASVSEPFQVPATAC